MKKLLLIFCLLFSLALASAQSDYGKFAYGFGAAGGETGKTSYVLGMPFYSQAENAGSYSVCEGVMQAQLIRLDMVLEGCQNDSAHVSPAHVKDTTKFFMDYPGEDIVFRGRTINVFPAGTYDSTAFDAGHYSWGASYNYDSLTTLLLNVWPIYEMFDTLYLDSTEIVTDYARNTLFIPDYAWHQLHGGPNEYALFTVEHNCDSIRHFFVNLCGGTTKDADGNGYESVYIGTAPMRYCWTNSNMRTTHYVSDGSEVDNMIYKGDGHDDEALNLATYGRLYTWYSAVQLPNGSDANPDTVPGGFVMGICPLGWHIPDENNIGSLMDIPAFNLMADSPLWMERGPSSEMNTTGFSALPAGFYNPQSNRFENMQGETYFWSTSKHVSECWVCSLAYGCNKVITEELGLEGGVSVRCVKNQMFHDDGSEWND